MKNPVGIFRRSGVDVGDEPQDFIGDGGRERNAFRDHGRRRFRGHAENRAGQVGRQRRLPFRLELRAGIPFAPPLATVTPRKQASPFSRLKGRSPSAAAASALAPAAEMFRTTWIFAGLRLEIRTADDPPAAKNPEATARRFPAAAPNKTGFAPALQLAQQIEGVAGKSGGALSRQTVFAVFKPGDGQGNAQQKKNSARTGARRPAPARWTRSVGRVWRRMSSSASFRFVISIFGHYEKSRRDFAGNLFDAGIRGEGTFSMSKDTPDSNFVKFIFGIDNQFTSKLYALIEYQYNGEGTANKYNYDLLGLINGRIINLSRNYLDASVSYQLTPLLTVIFQIIQI